MRQHAPDTYVQRLGVARYCLTRQGRQGPPGTLSDAVERYWRAVGRTALGDVPVMIPGTGIVPMRDARLATMSMTEDTG